MQYWKKCTCLITALMMFSSIPPYGLAEGSAGTVEVTAEMLTDTTQRYTLIVDGVEIPLAEGVYDNAILAASEAYGQFGSSGQGDANDYDFRSALYVDQTGVNAGKSVEEAIQGGSVTDTQANGITVKATSDGFSGIIVDGADYTVSDADIQLITNSDGSGVNDFTGLGAALISSNNGVLRLLRSTVNTTGVAKLAVLTDNGAATYVEDSEIHVQGGTLYDGYQNNSNMATMVSPPWVLGIAGNARLSNMEGKYSLLTVVNSKITSGGWGVLSTDSGSDMQIVAVDSEITLDQSNANYTNDPYLDSYGTGYGAFAIGQAQENFYGTTINAGTYVGVLTGGYMSFGDSNFENGTLSVSKLSGDAESEDILGHIVTGHASEATFEGIKGKGQVSTLNSDGFGFMTWGSAAIKLSEGTVLNTDEAAFLIKSPDTSVLVEGGSQVNARGGILLQMIDDENNMVGTGAQQVFNTELTETPGWPSEHGEVTETSEGGYAEFTMNGTALTGNLYNGTGYRGQSGRTLVVSIEEAATLSGDILATETIHVNECYDGTNALEAQNTPITADQYYYIGRVANRSCFNGNNYVQVMVKNGGTWYPQETSLITYLDIEEGGKVYATVTDNGDGTLTLIPSDTALTAGSYGTANELVQVSGGFSFGGFDPSQMDGFDPSQGGDFGPSQGGSFDPSQGGDFGPSQGGSSNPPQGGDFGPSQGGSFDPSQGGQL